MPAKLYAPGRKDRTVEQKLDDQAKFITGLRKRDAAATAAKKKKGTWVSRLKKRVQRVLKSRHSPAGKKYLAEKKIQSKKTVRTKAVESGLKVAGLTEKEIARFRKR